MNLIYVKLFGLNNLHQDFDIIIPRAKHVFNTFKLRTFMNLSLYTFSFAPVISTSIHRCVNNFHDIKVLMKVIKTETFNIGFTSKQIHQIWVIVFLLSS